MANVLFNKSGAPLMAFGKPFFMNTTGAPAERPPITKQTEIPEDTEAAGSKEAVPWGANNNFPGEANEIIRSVGVLNSGLKFIRNFTVGQGVFPAIVEGYDLDGREQLSIAPDKELIAWCNSRMVRRYLEKAARDYFRYGSADVQLVPDINGQKIIGLNPLNKLYARYAPSNKLGVIDKLIYSAKWPDTPGNGEYEELDVLDEYDPLADMLRRRMAKKATAKPIVFAIRDSWSNAEYYPEPIWYSALLAGWIDVARIVPQFLKKAYENQITWKWHVKIPYAFWDKKFPEKDYPDTKMREQAINDYIDNLEDSLVSHENADKAIFTFFEINPTNGKAEEQWIIEPLDNKYKENDKLITSAAANSEILFSLMLNPNVLGAGMPGGTYAGNQGGSNIREAFLVNIANAWIDRQNLLDPLTAMLQYNGHENVVLRFRSTILTTLDTGAGTKNIIS